MSTQQPGTQQSGTQQSGTQRPGTWRSGPRQAVAPEPPEPPEPPVRWARPALLALLLVTAVLYLWSLSASGYANQFYSAAVQAGSESWKAFFFGSSDAANSITVDKPPAALWPMALSVRLFGLSSWAILVPEALMGVAAVGVLHGAVRRRFGAGAGLLAGGALAVTPVAALMFRFNNPDALLCLLMVGAIACVLRALEDGRTKWLLLAGVCFGLGFLTKTLQAWLILPPLAVVYACCAPVALRRRFGQLLLAGLVIVVSGGWWVAIVELWPAASRPYIGGSQHNSFLELTFGYNGFGRLSGNETGSVGGGRPGGGPGGGGGGGAWGETGITRLFSSDMGGQISWLLPAALILLVAGVALLWRARRADAAEQAGQRAEFLVWGGALLMTFTTFSFMSGIFHQYYNIALAPYIAALVGMGAALLWRRGGRGAALVLAGTVAVTAGWSFVLLNRSPDWLPWLRWTVLALGLLAALGLLLSVRAGAGSRAGVAAGASRRVAVLAAGLGVVTALAGPVAYTLDTVNTAKGGSIIMAGPSVQGGRAGPGGGFPGARMRGRNGGVPGAQPGFPGGKGGMGGFGERGAGRMGGMGGLVNGAKVSDRAKELLKKDADDYTWAAATIGSQNAASYQLATGKPVMAIGGFNGSDPSPTLARFKEYVADGKIHYFLAGGRGGPGGDRGGSSQITSWVTKTFKKVTVGSTTFYDLTRKA
ncbi:ArnT family glycosyltransferase [Streptomyces tubercidicus]|uniref:Glycosyl transferase n=1 Tax=Streptomyces tubercidicus TaxID=47759 RepID=A0A640UUL7_9ACTN|nr:glycosyltransferase family 39 protein [Streptomyces tubercidicus]WAU12896.1 glycosyltransferase family 39 protein [Streptomyces tubercidicus]GFE38411.1 glycosyl transferase [Streptomyces tubercidicus]